MTGHTGGGGLIYEVAETDDGRYTILDTRTGTPMMGATPRKALAFEQCGALNRQGVVRHTRETERQPAPRILNLEARRRFDALRFVDGADNSVDNGAAGVA